MGKTSKSEKPHLRKSSKDHSPDPIELSSKTPQKTNPPRTRNRGVALSVTDVRKVAEGLQRHDTTSSQAKTVRRKIALPSPLKHMTAPNEPFKLPEKYEILAEFFDGLDSSIRLLRLKGSKTSFTNISRKVECLTDRRFTHSHLAKLKFILPEAIVVKRLLVFDEGTSCMKPDLHVTIDLDALESDRDCGSVPLRKLFRSRLRDFCESHPEGDEIPEETLPEPFNHPKQGRIPDILITPSPSFTTGTLFDACAAHPPKILSACMLNNDIVDNTEHANIEKTVSVKTSIEALDQRPTPASHMSQSFRRSFSQKSKENGEDDAPQEFPSDSSQPLAFTASASSLKKKHPIVGTKSHSRTFTDKLASEAASSEMCTTICASQDCLSDPPATPCKDVPLESIDAMSTPAKLVSTPLRLMSATPALSTPKRHMCPNDNSASTNKLVRRPPRSRSLKFDTPVKNKQTESEADNGGLSIDDDIFDILPENLLQSIREKERVAMEERDPAVSQAKRRQKMIARLPKLFNMIHLLFHSINHSVITKEELVSKIISGHCDIVGRGEVEEQLNLLLELVPEWISEKSASSGDLLFCINKMLNPDTIRASLEEAK
ncbi:CDT1-like protein b [Gastrolobium bilobum]|uniref:CDT1-like protein b n=1 Tax=Gastrolobium bilobum TaxID=150636 RepID=UPI002AB109F7|nr:CDT1-like protein b [Gastrolobium bilobum]